MVRKHSNRRGSLAWAPIGLGLTSWRRSMGVPLLLGWRGMGRVPVDPNPAQLPPDPAHRPNPPRLVANDSGNDSMGAHRQRLTPLSGSMGVPYFLCLVSFLRKHK